MVTALIFSGYGINCEQETKRAFELAGANADIVHLNDLIAEPSRLKNYQIAAFPGGFSFGDDTGSGKAYANMIKNHLLKEIKAFVARDTLTIGICNGFQVLTSLDLLKGTLTHNTSAQFIDRWVDLKVSSDSPWLKGIEFMSLPVAHGEGRYIRHCDERSEVATPSDLKVALQYTAAEITEYFDYPANPNGSDDDIAAVLSDDGRILGMMPHPERAIEFHHLPHWTFLKEKASRASMALPENGPGLRLFENAVEYFN
ncbi:MAG: phosphoribosylformylglycinamidine synthase subunit PurQ [Cyanobacteria bacterium]|nr:phosphoribosylformylglycinamidine synthase subunit PurQ [Cyanobacteriota bacterium]MDA1020810.1 phosphoribosylformylglycinamidine synthase subunit PurQ [Cyanobacteriota bacterium]